MASSLRSGIIPGRIFLFANMVEMVQVAAVAVSEKPEISVNFLEAELVDLILFGAHKKGFLIAKQHIESGKRSIYAGNILLQVHLVGIIE